MKVATGTVVDGKVVLEGEPLAEGAVVTVVARDDDDTFDVSPEEERALLEAIAQDRKSTRLNSSHSAKSRMPSSA